MWVAAAPSPRPHFRFLELTRGFYLGDMVLPVCSLCVRTDSICLFPTTRKPRTLGRRRHHKRVDGAGMSSPLSYNNQEHE